MITKRKKEQYNKLWTIASFPTPIGYVKQLFDSANFGARVDYLEEYEFHGRRYVMGAYERYEGEDKKQIAQAIVQLLDDPDYSCDAIPVAAELGLPEARKWFLKLSEKPVEEIRQIKTSDYVNGLVCLLNFSSKHSIFLNYLKSLLDLQNLSYSERLSVINKIAIHEPSLVIENYNKLLQEVLNMWRGREIDKDLIIYRSLCEAFDKVGVGQCINIANKMKNEASKDLQSLYYYSMSKLPKYKPYLPKLKKILEITE